MVKGYSIDFLENTYQTRKNPNAKFMLPQEILVEQEINDLLEMGAIQKAIYQKNQFVSHLFLVSKKSWRQRSVINLKELSQLIPYHHFKIEGLYLLKKILEKGDYLRKLHLKDSYFCVPLYEDSKKSLRIKWKDTLYEFFCLCFGLTPAPRLSTKLLKVPVTILRKLNIRVNLYI